MDNRLTKIFEDITGKTPTEKTTFDELEMDSLDIADMSFRIEDTYGITFPNDFRMAITGNTTVQDVINILPKPCR